jgi:hypothetical protein
MHSVRRTVWFAVAVAACGGLGSLAILSGALPDDVPAQQRGVALAAFTALATGILLITASRRYWFRGHRRRHHR